MPVPFLGIHCHHVRHGAYAHTRPNPFTSCIGRACMSSLRKEIIGNTKAIRSRACTLRCLLTTLLLRVLRHRACLIFKAALQSNFLNRQSISAKSKSRIVGRAVRLQISMSENRYGKGSCSVFKVCGKLVISSYNAHCQSTVWRYGSKGYRW